jgi:hypothetical protein
VVALRAKVFGIDGVYDWAAPRQWRSANELMQCLRRPP